MTECCRYAIHQPHYLPYPGFFHKMLNCDGFVILDTCQMKRSSGADVFENRNRIKTPNGVKWLTVPITRKRKSGITFKEALIAGSAWRAEHIHKLEAAYRGSEHFAEGMALAKAILLPEHRTMAGLGLYCAQISAKMLGIEPRLGILLVSQKYDRMGIQGDAALIGLCKALGATEYISGPGGRDYIDPGLFEKAGIELIWQEYEPIEYRQQHGEFEPNLSIIDVIFNIGLEAAATALREA